METPPVHSMNLTGVLSESKRIITSNYSHFFTLSLLFYFPLAFSLIISPAAVLSGQLLTVDHLFNHPQTHQTLLILFHLLYIITVYTLALCATATITYSTYHAYSGELVNFSTTVRSLTATFFPTASTAITAHVLVFLISLTFFILVRLILTLIQTLGFVITDYNPIYFVSFSILTLIIIYLYVNWSLALVVAVTESKWGFAPLIRSSYLVKGMKTVSLFSFLYFGISGLLFVWLCWHGFDPFDRRAFMWLTMPASFFMMMMLLRLTAANTVLYVYCINLHGESVIRVNEGFDREYVNLPSDYVKPAPAVSIVTA